MLDDVRRWCHGVRDLRRLHFPTPFRKVRTVLPPPEGLDPLG